MGFFKSKKGSIISDYFMHLGGIPGIGENIGIELSLYDDHLEFTAKHPISLDYSQITDVYYGDEKEIVTKNKSVIGRAAAGGMLFGPVGAIVGGLSGSGQKEKTKHTFIFVISYKSTQGTDEFIRLEDTRLYKGVKIYKKLRELCNIETEIPTKL